MGNYVKRQFSGTHVSKETVVEKVIEKEQSPINLSDLAEAVAKALSKNMPASWNGINTPSLPVVDTFDNEKTLARMSEAMIIQKGNGEANFDSLGEESKTKRSKEATKKTIDLLKNLKD